MGCLLVIGVAVLLTLLSLCRSERSRDWLLIALFVCCLALATVLVLRDWTDGDDGCHGGLEKMPTPRETTNTK